MLSSLKKNVGEYQSSEEQIYLAMREQQYQISYRLAMMNRLECNFQSNNSVCWKLKGTGMNLYSRRMGIFGLPEYRSSNHPLKPSTSLALVTTNQRSQLGTCARNGP